MSSHSDMIARLHVELGQLRRRIEELERREAESRQDQCQLLSMIECLAGGWRSCLVETRHSTSERATCECERPADGATAPTKAVG